MQPRTQMTTTYQPRKTEEVEEVVGVVELRTPGSFDFGDHGGGGAARETLGAGTVDPLDVGMLENLWWRNQLR